MKHNFRLVRWCPAGLKIGQSTPGVMFLGLLFLVSQLSCMCMFPMMRGQHGGHDGGEAAKSGERLALLQNEDISVLVTSPDYPFYTGNPFSIDVLLTNSSTNKPIEAGSIEVRVEKDGESQSAESSKNGFIQQSVTDENGACRFKFSFPDAGTYHFNVIVNIAEKSYNLKFTQGVQNSSHLKHSSNH